MQAIMNALGDGEERGIALDDQPAGVDTGPACITQQRLQHFGYTAPGGSGVHMPYNAVREHGPDPPDCQTHGLGTALTDDRVEALDGQARHTNFLDLGKVGEILLSIVFQGVSAGALIGAYGTEVQRL